MKLSRLPAAERARWASLLAEPPVLSDAERTLDPVASVLAFAGGVLLAWGALTLPETLLDPRWFFAAALLGGLSGATIAGSLRAGWRHWCVDRAPHAVGRFLFGWGYAEVDVDRVRFVAGEEIQHRVDVRPARATGASEIRVELRAGPWGAHFVLVGLPEDVPHDALSALGAPRTEGTGYRSPARGVLAGTRARGRSPRRVDALVLVLAGGLGLLAATAWSATSDLLSADGAYLTDRYEQWVTLSRNHPLPWIRAAAAERRAAMVEEARGHIRERVREPYAAALVGLAGDTWPSVDGFHSCQLAEDELAALGRPRRFVYVPSDPFLYTLFEHAAPYRTWNTARARFASNCSLERAGEGEHPPIRAELAWSLFLDGDPVVARAATIEPGLIDAIARCTASDHDRAEAEERGIATLLGLVIHRDVYGAPDWVRRASPVSLEGFEELAPCVEAAAEQVVVRDL